MKRDTSKRSKVIKSLLVGLSITLVPLVAGTAQAQPAADDQYEGRTGVGYDAADDAVTASEAFDDAEADGSEESAPSAAEDQPAPGGLETAAAEEIAETAGPEEGIELTSLPETGGSSPLALGVLLVAGGLLTGYVARSAQGR